MSALFSFLAAQNSQYGAKELKQQIISSTRTGLFVSLLVMFAFFGIYKLTEIIVDTTPKPPKGFGDVELITLNPTPPVNIPIQIEQTSSLQQTLGTLTIAGRIVPVSSDMQTTDIAELKDMGLVSATKGTSDRIDIDNLKLDDFPKGVDVRGVVEQAIVQDGEFNPVEKEAVVDYEGLQKTIVYPPIPLKTGIEGSVVVQVLIAADGRPAQTRVLSSTNVAFNKEAIRAVMEFTGYKPAIQNQAPVAYWIAIPINFKLK